MSVALHLSTRQVVLMQAILTACHDDDGRPFYAHAIDGSFGPWTEKGVCAFQEAVGHLDATGRVDTETWAALLAAGDSVLDSLQGDDGEPHNWDPLPDGIFAQVLRLCQACITYAVVYGPGRAAFDAARFVWVVTQGAFGVGSGTYPTKRRGPAFVCSSWTYFVIMYVLRLYEVYNRAKAGAQPPLSVVVTSSPTIQTWKNSGPWYGASPWFRKVSATGESRARNGRVQRGYLDLLEFWDRLERDPRSVPELSVWEWASAARGFVHHTALVLVDRANRTIYFVDAGGWKSNGVFSGTLMDIQTIRTREEAEAFSKKGWGRAYGLDVSGELHVTQARPMPGLAFEVAPGKVEVAWEAAA